MSIFTEYDTIYCTGVFLQPFFTKDGIWEWRVVSFDESSYFDGEICQPNIDAEKLQDLLVLE